MACAGSDLRRVGDGEHLHLCAEARGDRYVLNEKQERLLRRIMLRENNALFARHSDRIMGYALEAMQTRAAGEPFTPEQVQRWVELAEPVFQDGRRSIVKAAGEFEAVLEPEQKELLQADLNAANGVVHVIDAVLLPPPK